MTGLKGAGRHAPREERPHRAPAAPPPQKHPTRLRIGLAIVRLALLYGLACFVVLAAGLTWRATLEAGAGLRPDQLPAHAAGAQIPFAGINIQLATHPTAAQRARLAELRAAGFGWARQHFAWQRLEPAPGRYDWAAADALVAAIIDAGLEPVAVLNGAPAWAQAPVDRDAHNPLAPPADFDALARFAAAFAARYGDRIRYYQIWDEPNIAPHWGARHISPVGYAQMLRAVTPALRAADADAVVLAAALAPTVDRGHLAIDEVYFLQRMIAAGAAPFFDVVAIQPFGFGQAPDAARQDGATLNFARAALIRRALVAAGLGAKPIWAVRYGWNRAINAPWRTVTPAMQAAYARDALERAWQHWPWLAAMGWASDQPAAAPDMPVWGFALHTVTGAAAPVEAALRSWQTAAQGPRDAAAHALPWSAWAGVLLAAVLVGWRTLAAVRVTPWRAWLARFQQAPPALQAGVWLTWIAVYYLATFPPWIGLCWLAAVLLCLAQPRVGLWLAVAAIPFYYQHKEVALVDVTVVAPPAHVLILALLPAWLMHCRPGGQDAPGRRGSLLAPYAARPLVWWELAPLLLAPLTVLSAVQVWHWPAYARGAFDLVIVPLLLWLVVRTLAPAAADRRRVLMALLAGGVLAALVGWAGWLRGEGAVVDGIRRLVGPHFSPNHTALYLERTFFIGIAALIVAGRRGRPLVLGALLAVAGALVLTGSRGALLLGAPAGLAVLALLAGARRPGRWQWLGWLLLAAVAALGVGLLVGQRVRLANLETIELRLEMWRAALALWRDHFWSGVGPGGYFWRYPAYLPAGAVEVDVLHPHNLWLELVTTWGVLGIAWLALCGLALVKALQHQRRAQDPSFWIAAGATAGLAAALMHAQTDTFLLLADLAAWNAVAWALATAPVEAEPPT